MASETQICNLALSHISVGAIESLTEKTKQARECRLLYEPVRDETLRDHPWGFAEKQQALALTTETRNGWLYVYGWPSDCIAARSIYDESAVIHSSDQAQGNGGGSIRPIPFKIGTTTDLSKRVILTDKANAELIYTAKITNANVFDAQFISALSFNLASRLAITLKRDKALRSAMLQEYTFRLGRATFADANEGSKDSDNTSAYTRSRR